MAAPVGPGCDVVRYSVWREALSGTRLGTARDLFPTSSCGDLSIRTGRSIHDLRDSRILER